MGPAITTMNLEQQKNNQEVIRIDFFWLKRQLCCSYTSRYKHPDPKYKVCLSLFGSRAAKRNTRSSARMCGVVQTKMWRLLKRIISDERTNQLSVRTRTTIQVNVISVCISVPNKVADERINKHKSPYLVYQFRETRRKTTSVSSETNRAQCCTLFTMHY